MDIIFSNVKDSLNTTINIINDSNDEENTENNSVEIEQSLIGNLKPFEPITNIPYSEPSEYEKSMLKGTLNPSELIFQEAREAQEEEQKKEDKEDNEAQTLRVRHQYITMVKVLALVKAGKAPLDNPSTFMKYEKLTIIQNMDEIMNNMSPDEIKEEFNKICNTKIFVDGANYDSMTCGK